MSSSKEIEDHQSSSSTVFAALVQHLERSFRQDGVVKIPSEIVLPFRKTSLTDANFPLRDLHKVLEIGRPKNVLRLAPASLCTIVSIVLQVPYSLVQLKLIHLIMDVLRQHRNAAAFSAVLTRAHAMPVTADDVKTQKDLICKNMATCILRHLTNADKNQLLRYTMTQLLAVVLYTSPIARESIASAPEWRVLASLIQTDENCLLRILTANVVRQMLCNNTESARFKKSLGSSRNIETFPVSERADSDWLNRIMEYVNSSDERCTVSGERERLYRVKRFESQQDGPQATADRPVLIAGVSSDVTLLMPENPDIPTMFSIPIMDCLSMNKIRLESDPYAIELKFPDNVGYRIKNGTKNAMDNITVVLQDDEAADSFLREIQERQIFAHTSIHEAVSMSGKNENRASISATFVDLHLDTSEASVDEHDKLGTFCTEAQSSDFEISSPLEDLSQRSLQKKANPPSDSERKERNASAGMNAENSGSKAARRQVTGPNSVHQPSKHDSKSRMLDLETKGGVKQAGRPSQRKKGLSSNKEGTSQRVASSKLPGHGQAPSDESPPNLNTTEANEQANVKKTRTMPSVAPKPSDEPPATSHKLKSTTQKQHDKVPRKFTQTPATMAHQGGDKSQNSPPPAPTKPALKKRSLKQSIKGCKLSQTQVPPESLPNEFDLPSVDQESEHPKKKVKIKSSKQPTEISEAAGYSGKGTGATKVSDSRKTAVERIRERKKGGKSTNKKEPKTAASTRARRAVKSQAYVESSDSQSEDAQEDHGDVQTEEKKERKEDNTEFAEDSYPVSKEQAEIALQNSELNFDSKLQKMVSSSDRKNRVSVTRQSVGATEPGQKATPMRTIQPISESSIPPVSESKVRRSSIIQFGPNGPKNQAYPVTPAAIVTTQPTKRLLAQDQVTPIEFQKRVSTEKDNTDENPKGEASRRRTSPATTSDNEQRLASPAAMDTQNLVIHSPERTTVMDHDMEAHISPNKDTVNGCIVDANVLDVQDVQDHVIADNAALESGLNAKETWNDAVGLSRHDEEPSRRKIVSRGLPQGHVEVSRGISASSGCSLAAASPETLAMIEPTDPKTDKKQTKMTTHPCESSRAAGTERRTILKTSANDEIEEETHDLKSYAEEDTSPSVPSNDDISRHESAEYISSDSSDSVVELPIAMHDAGCQTMRSSLEAASHPATPLPEESVHAKVRTRPQDTAVFQLHDRRRIGVATGIDERYLQNEKTINMNKRSSTLRLVGEVENICDHTVPPPQEALEKTDASAPPNDWNGRIVPSTNNVGRGAQPSQDDPMRRISDSRKALPSMAPPPPPRRTKPEAGIALHRVPASDSANAVAPAPPQAQLRKSGQLHPSHASTSTVRVAKETTEPMAFVPVRIKRTITSPNEIKEATIADLNTLPGTPVSFCTRLDMDAPTFDVGLNGPELTTEGRPSARQSGDGSTTLVNEDQSFLYRSPGPCRSRILARSMSTEAMSPSHKTRTSPLNKRHRPRAVEARSSQRGLLDSIMEITSDVLCRLGQEEDTVKSKVHEFFRGGDMIIQTLTDTWNERLGHEHRNLLTKLEEEKEVLRKASKLIEEQDVRSWKEMICNPMRKEERDRGNDSLIARTEALKNGH